MGEQQHTESPGGQYPAPCLGGTTCSQAFRYTWDELGRLQRARRWDVAATTFPTVPPTEAAPKAVRGKRGVVVELVVKRLDDQPHLPVVELRRAA